MNNSGEPLFTIHCQIPFVQYPKAELWNDNIVHDKVKVLISSYGGFM